MAAKARQLTPRTVTALDSLAAMWAEVDKHREPALLDRPANGFTIAEYAERYGVSIATADPQVNKLVASGKVTKARCLITSRDGSRRAVNVYVLKGV